MDALRLSHATTRVQEQFEGLEPQFQLPRINLLAVYRRWRSSTFSTVTYLTVIAAVAIYDIVLTLRYWESLKQLEENPIGRWLMNLDHVENGVMPNLTLFLILKGLGTLIVLLTIYTLIKRRGSIGHPIAAGVSSFQLGLATYLTFGAYYV